jgi:hypothetical protein
MVPGAISCYPAWHYLAALGYEFLQPGGVLVIYVCYFFSAKFAYPFPEKHRASSSEFRFFPFFYYHYALASL